MATNRKSEPRRSWLHKPNKQTKKEKKNRKRDHTVVSRRSVEFPKRKAWGDLTRSIRFSWGPPCTCAVRWWRSVSGLMPANAHAIQQISAESARANARRKTLRPQQTFQTTRHCRKRFPPPPRRKDRGCSTAIAQTAASKRTFDTANMRPTRACTAHHKQQGCGGRDLRHQQLRKSRGCCTAMAIPRRRARAPCTAALRAGLWTWPSGCSAGGGW